MLQSRISDARTHARTHARTQSIALPFSVVKFFPHISNINFQAFLARIITDGVRLFAS